MCLRIEDDATINTCVRSVNKLIKPFPYVRIRCNGFVIRDSSKTNASCRDLKIIFVFCAFLKSSVKRRISITLIWLIRFFLVAFFSFWLAFSLFFLVTIYHGHENRTVCMYVYVNTCRIFFTLGIALPLCS